MLHWRTSSQVCQRGICQHCSAQTKWLLIFNSRILWDLVAHPGCPNLSQNYFTEILNTAPEVKGAWFLNALHPVCRGKCEIPPLQSAPVPPALYQVCVCCSAAIADLALWLWWCGMSCSGLLAEFHRGFLNKVIEFHLLPSTSCCLTSGKIFFSRVKLTPFLINSCGLPIGFARSIFTIVWGDVIESEQED